MWVEVQAAQGGAVIHPEVAAENLYIFQGSGGWKIGLKRRQVAL
jgi:hypothetical protein